MRVPPLVADIQNFARDVSDTVREPLLVIDAALRVRSANPALNEVQSVTIPLVAHVR